ncbi:hypothetical protein RIF29_30950 [Crotalaria pallida]|uniref:Uncharacterized protein n=1 Tax=Crotalaria pallida TaxID=3830 RepID=A0AAN9I1J8_CROPI
MATLMKTLQFVFLIIILALFVVSSEARLVPQFSAQVKRINSKVDLHELINYVRNNEWHSKRSMLGGKLERVSPAGPDAQHH